MTRRIILWCLVVTVLLPLTLIALVFAYAQTGIGKRQLAGLIGDVASQPGTTVTVTGISGFVPVDMAVSRIAVADTDGTWLTLDGVSLDWSPLALVTGTLVVDTLSAEHLTLVRTPETGTPPEPPPETDGPLLPELPVAVRLDRLAVDRLTIGDALLGEAVDLRLALSATLGPPADGLSVDAEVERIDATPGRLTLAASYVPESGRLSVDLAAEEPAGGLLARTADLPGLPPVLIGIQGDGTTDDWIAEVTLAAGPSLNLGGALRLAAADDRVRFGADLEAIVDGVVPVELQGLVEGGVVLATQATLEGDAVGLEGLRVQTAAGRVDLTGRLDLAMSTAQWEFRVEPAPVAWSTFLPDLAIASVLIEGTGAGPVGAPTAQIDLQATGIAFGDTTAEGLTVTVTRADAPSDLDHRIDGRIVATGLAVADAPLPALGPDPVVDLALDLAEDGRLRLDRLTIDGRSAAVSATGTAEGWGETATVNLQATVEDFASIPDLAALGLGGTTAIDIAVSRGAMGIDADLAARWDSPVTGVSQVDDALGDTVILATRMSLPDDGPMTLSNLAVDAGPLRLAADGVLDDREVAAVVSASLTDLGVLLDDAAGTLTVGADVFGTLDSLALELRAGLESARLAGLDIPELELSVDAVDLMAAPQARVGVAGTVAGLTVALDTQVAADTDWRIVADPLRLTAGPAAVEGSLTATADGLVTGSLQGRVASLEAFATLLGQPLAGSMGIGLTLSAAEGAQNANLQVDVAGLVFGEAIAAGRVGLTATAADLTGEMRVSGRLDASGIEAGGPAIDTASLTVSGPLSRLAVSLEAAGTLDEIEARLAARATAAFAETISVELATLTAVLNDIAITTSAPATIRLTPTGPSLENLRLTADGGSIALDASLAPNLRADLEITDLPLTLTNLFAPDLIAGGRLDGRVRLDASPATPRAELALTATGLSPGVVAAAGLGAIDADVSGTLAGGLFALDGNISGPAGAVGIAGSIPLIVAGGLLQPPAEPEIRAGVRGQLELPQFNALLSGADRLAGTLDLDLAVAGPVDSLAGQGEIRLLEAGYANPLIGIEVDGINATLTGTNDSLTLTQFEARTPNGGRVTGQGAIDLDALAGFPVSFRLTADDAQVVDRAEATVIVDADLDLSGPMLDTPRLSGSVRIDSAELRIPEGLPRAFPVIPVTEINLPPELAARRPPPDAGSAGGGGGIDPQLDIRIEAPGRIFVRGRGAELELAADMQVLGRASAPRIEGGLSLRGGTLDLLGNVLTFDRANVSFFGDGSLTPQLDVLASAPLDQITATVTVTGTADDPDLRFSSEPELPEDEVLARLLFGKATGALSPFEAIQLADSIATLSGVGGPGVLDRVRESIGIDRLSVGEDGAGGATVSVGSRVTDDVLVTVEQGTGPGSGRVGVEVELTDNIILETDAGADATGRAGIRFQWEY